MPIRIYALAKELGIDSKELVGACTKVGIPGKGSALASLSDDEVAKVKSFLLGSQQGGDAGGESTRPAGGPGAREKVGRGGGLAGRSRRGAEADTSAPAPISREDYIGPTGLGGKIKVIDTRKKTSRREPSSTEHPPTEQAPSAEESLTEQPSAEAESPPAASEQPPTKAERPVASPEPEAAEQPPAQTPPEQTSEPAKAPGTEPAGAGDQAAPTPPRSPAPPPTKDEDLLRPLKPGESDSIKVIGGPSGKKGGEKKKTGEERKPKRRAPVINVAPAPMPKAKHRTSPPKKEEPKAQEPEIRLPKEAMTARKGQPVQPPEAKEGKPEKKSKKKKEAKRHAPGEVAPPEEGAPPSSRRRGKDKKAKEPEREATGLTGLASARADRKARRASRKTEATPLEGGGQAATQQPRQRRRLVRRGTNTAAPRKGKVTLELPCTIRSVSEATGVGAGQLQKTLMGMGLMVNINSTIDTEYVEMLAAELGLDVELKQREKLEDSLITSILETEDDPDQLQPRAPIVTFLGHVDHGKTSLLDYLIGLNVVADEEGGITQHIRAYRIEKDGRPIAFVDTPGHEAFTEMRLRGANVTDVAILVVAADDGIMPQTEEAISHAKAAGVPIVVALNKCDLPGADPNRVMTQMTEHDLTPSQWVET
ncbi:MAG: translation initiation factor IF-2 N-terminal domain-containing protein [Pirellulaceae bacterium]